MKKRKKGLIKNNSNKKIQSVIDGLEALISDDYISNDEFFVPELKRLIARLKDTTFKIVVVGEFSSGKSTFINALIGRDLLDHGRKETTATITEIINDYKAGDSIRINVCFNDGTKRDDISVDDIKKVTTTDSEMCNVADAIDKVSIHSKVLDNNEDICFIDTPGLNGIADKHREKTIEQIKNSHACIYLIQLRGLGESDIEFVKYLCKYQKNIIFVQNFIDELKSGEGETPEQKIEAQKKIIEEKILNDVKDIDFMIVGVSGRKALFAKSREFNSYNEEELTEEVRKRLYTESQFDDILKCINKLIKKNEQNQVQEGGTIKSAIECLDRLKADLERRKEEQLEEWRNSAEGKNAANIEGKINALKKRHDDEKQRLKNYIDKETEEIRKNNKKGIEEGIENIEEKLEEELKKELDKLPSKTEKIEAIEGRIPRGLPEKLNNKVVELKNSRNEYLNIKFENLITTAVLGIYQFVGNQVGELNIPKFKIEENSMNLQEFSEEDDEIFRRRRKLNERRQLYEQENEELKPAKKEAIRTEEELLRTTIQYKDIAKEKATEEYLREAKENIRKRVHGYLDGQIKEIFVNSFNVSVAENKKIVEKRIFSLFEKSYEKKLKKLEESSPKGNKGGKDSDSPLERFLKKTELTYKKLEEYLCQIQI